MDNYTNYDLDRSLPLTGILAQELCETFEEALLPYKRDASPFWAYTGSTANLPPDGWKIHVSFNPEFAVEAAIAIKKFCDHNNLHGKIIKSIGLLERLNSGVMYPTSQIGKAATIYFENVDLLCLKITLLKELTPFFGPPVLTDRRVLGSKCLYARYGRFLVSSNLQNFSIPCASDQRSLKYILDDDELKIPDRFLSVKLKKISAKGFALTAHDINSERGVFVKTGYTYGRLSRGLPLGDEMLMKEEENFLKIQKSDAIHIPKLVESFRTGDLYYSVRELIRGPDLSVLYSKGSKNLIENFRSGIYRSLVDFFKRLELHQLRMFDLSPANFVLGADSIVYLVDAEHILGHNDDAPPVFTYMPNDIASACVNQFDASERYEYEKDRLLSFISTS